MNAGPRPRIYSVGHSSRSIEQLLGLLASYRIERLVDVRSFPSSRRHPQFIKKALNEALGEAGVDYVHLGDDLGGYRSEPYEEYMATDLSLPCSDPHVHKYLRNKLLNSFCF